MLAAIGLLAASVGASAADPGADRIGELLHLIRHDCGACHGLTLAGGLGPALLPQALREKPAEGLARTILDGRPGTAMPPWNAFVDEAEARWIVDMLIKGMPDVH